jgi:type VI secretion system protein ImpC
LLETSAAAPDVEPWTLVIGDFLFGPDGGDIKTLSEVGAICRSLGAIFLAGADPALLGCPDLRTHPDPRDWTDRFPDTENAWRDLRHNPAAQAIGLALPRVLLRLPYGKDTDPCELFAFEEIFGAPDHTSFLWGNPAFFCARLIAQAYSREGAYAPGPFGDIDDLPAYINREGAEATMQACAEVYLSEAAGEAITRAGFIPVLSYQRRNSVRLGPIQTLASAPTA